MQNKANANLRQYERYTRRKQAALILALLVTLTAALLYMGIGSIRLRPAEILRVFFGGGEAKHVTAIRNIRLPRVLAAMLIGAILAAVIIYAVLVIALRIITYEDCMLLPKGNKIAKILRIR